MTRVTETSASPVDDDRLLARIQDGDSEAFSLLYERYCVRAYRVAHAVCGDAGRAEDAVQEGFFSVWSGRECYRSEEIGAGTWILTLVRHRAIDLARRNSTHASRRGPESALADQVAREDVAGEAIDHADAPGLRKMLASLPDAQREVIGLAFYGQLSHSEISAYLRLPPGTVKGRMRLGLEKLRTELGS